MKTSNINFEKYKFYEDGRIWSESKKRFIIPQEIRGGYLGTTLVCKDGKSHPFKLHRVIAELFCDVPKHLESIPIEELDVDHINGVRTDNRSCNLRWCTRKENSNYELSKTNRSKSHVGNTVPNRWKIVIQLSKDGKFVKEWESLTAASVGTNTLLSSITSCCRGKFKSANGFMWKYKKG